MIGQIYEAQTQFRKAADSFMQMKSHKDAETAPVAVINAASIYQALQDYPAAIDALKEFIKLWPNHKSTPRAALKIADLLKEQGKLKEAYDGYMAFVKKYPKETAMVVEAQAKAGTVLHVTRHVRQCPDSRGR